MNAMASQGSIRSYKITIINSMTNQTQAFYLPLTIASPFVNRVFQEISYPQTMQLKEPWYRITPRIKGETPLPERSQHPQGPTSLSGKPYDIHKEPPPRLRLHPDSRIIHLFLEIMDLNIVIYQGEYYPDDMFLHIAENIARNCIQKGTISMSENAMYYSLDYSNKYVRYLSQDIFSDDLVNVQGVFRLPAREKQQSKLVFKKMAEAPLPEKNITDFGQTKTLGRGQKGKGIVIMHQHVYSQLLTDMKFSPQIEEGGYLPGKAYRKTGSPENVDDPNFQWIVEITDAVLAQNTRASSGALVFSGDSWSKISRQMDTEFSGKKLIGWFHTHLFEASDKFGLSGLDQDLHCQFLKKPFQIAILINISPDHQREVRCFQYGPSGFLEECLFEVTQ